MPSDTDESPLEPFGLLISSRNLFAIVFLLQFFLLVNGTYLYGLSFQVAVIYFLTPVALVAYLLNMTKTDKGGPITWQQLENSMVARKDKLTKYLKASGWKGSHFSVGVQVIYFCLAFGITYTAMAALAAQGYIQPGHVDAVTAKATMVTQLLLVAPSETIIFHSVVPLWSEGIFKKSSRRVMLTYGISQAIFASFHFAAYGASTGAMITAMALGILFLYLCRNYGIMAAVGAHAAWNLAVLGVGTAPLLGA